MLAGQAQALAQAVVQELAQRMWSDVTSADVGGLAKAEVAATTAAQAHAGQAQAQAQSQVQAVAQRMWSDATSADVAALAQAKVAQALAQRMWGEPH